MKTLSKVLPITLAFALAACNEKVASELKNSASSGSSGGPSAAAPSASTFTFKLTNVSPSVLNYKLHRTGYTPNLATGIPDSNREIPCEVKSLPNTSLSNTDFDAEAALLHDSKLFDISCFLEAEEISLYHSGFSLKLEASANACNFVGYSPFSYFSWMPGDSTTDYKTVKCPADNTLASVDPHGVDCGEYMNMNGGLSSSTPVYPGQTVATPTNEKELCRFDYTTDSGPNCDVGTITVTEYNYEYDDPTTPTTLVLSGTPTVRKVSCGGKVNNCINGPIKMLNNRSESGLVTQIERTETDAPYSKTFTFPGLITENTGNNRKYVNYRRDLANRDFDYSDRSFGGSNVLADLNTGLTNYKNAFNPAVALFNLWDRTFDPNFIENYSKNRRMLLPLANGNKYVNTSGPEYLDVFKPFGYKARPYASEPFQSVKSGIQVNPFYTFYCFDNASENKARIRLVVREWDKIFDTSEFDNLSDIFKDIDADPFTHPTQDNNSLDNYGEEVNDLQDWDDLIHMRRTAGVFTGGSLGNVLDNYTDYVPMIYQPADDGSWSYVNLIYNAEVDAAEADGNMMNNFNSTNARFYIEVFPQDSK